MNGNHIFLENPREGVVATDAEFIEVSAMKKENELRSMNQFWRR